MRDRVSDLVTDRSVNISELFSVALHVGIVYRHVEWNKLGISGTLVQSTGRQPDP